MNDPDGLREAIKRLEEINLSPDYGGRKPPGFGLGGEMAAAGYKPSGETGLPAHAASDTDRFSEINQRLDDLERMIINVMEKTGMFKKPGDPPTTPTEGKRNARQIR